MKKSYISWKPKKQTILIVNQANDIILNYNAQGYVLTLRQLYYQFVSRDLIENSERSYKNLGALVTKARMSGMIDWESIEDRNRGHQTYLIQESAGNIISKLPQKLVYDQWARQEYYIEVWVEKEALGNVVSRACGYLQTPYMSYKGYLSASEAWRAGRRFRAKMKDGYKCVLIHLGDHDPSGIDMTRDNRERIDLFSGFDGAVSVERIALNMNQIKEYSPPPNPAKITDTRAKSYIKKYGKVSWELDALEPSIIENLISNKIESYIDVDEWNDTLNAQNNKRNILKELSDNWCDVKEFLGK